MSRSALGGFRALRWVMVLIVAYAASVPAADWILGERPPERVTVAKRGEFDVVKLEAAAAGVANAHPVHLPAGQIKAGLKAMQYVETKGTPKALFADDEIEFLAEAIAQGLARARPQDEIVFLTTGKHEDGLFVPRLGTSGRAFFADGRLNLLIAETRVDFINQYRASRVMRRFEFGNRQHASAVVLDIPPTHGVHANNRRDWVALSPAPAAVVKPEGAPAATRNPDKALPESELYERQATRLRNLKRLHEQGLITEDEYQMKRREILQEL